MPAIESDLYNGNHVRLRFRVADGFDAAIVCRVVNALDVQGHYLLRFAHFKSQKGARHSCEAIWKKSRAAGVHLVEPQRLIGQFIAEATASRVKILGDD